MVGSLCDVLTQDGWREGGVSLGFSLLSTNTLLLLWGSVAFPRDLLGSPPMGVLWTGSLSPMSVLHVYCSVQQLSYVLDLCFFFFVLQGWVWEVGSSCDLVRMSGMYAASPGCSPFLFFLHALSLFRVP